MNGLTDGHIGKNVRVAYSIFHRYLIVLWN